MEGAPITLHTDEVDLETWGGRAGFRYSGSVRLGTKITYGKMKHASITAEEYRALLRRFRGTTVNIGTTRTYPPRGSVGDWLMANVTLNVIASYVGSILIAESYAEKANGPMIRLKR